jgi:His-Xaa-Ser system protein HxsD
MEKEDYVLVDLKIYPIDAVYGAAYVFLDRAYIFLEKGEKSKVRVNIKPKKGIKAEEKKTMKDDFLNEVINFSLRNSISENNRQIREYMIVTALSNSLGVKNLKSEENLSDKEDFLIDDKEFLIPWEREEFKIDDDPDGIAIPWELKEKKGKKKKK